MGCFKSKVQENHELTTESDIKDVKFKNAGPKFDFFSADFEYYIINKDTKDSDKIDYFNKVNNERDRNNELSRMLVFKSKN